jgi:outer membrane protein
MGQTMFARLFLMAAAGVLAAGSVSAQTKVGVVNMQQAVLATAEIKKASVDLTAKYKPQTSALEQLRADLEGIQKKLQAGQGKMPPAAEQDLNIEGQRKQRELQRMSQDLQEEVDSARSDILAGAGRRMQEVIRKLADERGLDVVVDTSSTVFFKSALDITQDAVAAYDKAYPVAK